MSAGPLETTGMRVRTVESLIDMRNLFHGNMNYHHEPTERINNRVRMA